MSRLANLTITTTVDEADMWAAEDELGAEQLQRVIAAAVSGALHVVAAGLEPTFAERVAGLYATGLCDALVAAELGVPKSNVAKVRRALGLAPNPCHNTPRRRK